VIKPKFFDPVSSKESEEFVAAKQRLIRVANVTIRKGKVTQVEKVYVGNVTEEPSAEPQ
jgi:hypothetical protein